VPLGITDCLNFGNPDKPEVFFQFREACRGIGDACRAFGTPVTGGNVSLYNESPTGAIDPTPTVGMVGLLDDVSHRVESAFRTPGDVILIAGKTAGHLGGSSYWEVVYQFVGGAPPPVDLDAEARLQRFLAEAARSGALASAHDASDGGLAVALAECCIGGPYQLAPLGAEVTLSGPAETAPAALLYGEDAGRVVLSAARDQVPTLVALADRHGVPLMMAGSVGAPEGTLEIKAAGSGTAYAWRTRALRQTYFDALPRRMRPAGDIPAGGP